MRSLHLPFVDVYVSPGGYSLTVFGVGLRIVDRRRHRALYGVRNSLVREWRIGPWGIGTIPAMRNKGVRP
jgi:hypothetical protein